METQLQKRKKISEMSDNILFYPLRWLIYVFNWVVTTKLPVFLNKRISKTTIFLFAFEERELLWFPL